MAINETYEEFVEKLKPKKTTDDCYTPPEVYEVIKNWVINKYKLGDKKIVRPFYPGGDYKNFKYNDDTVVIDNPPFSILAEIKRFYNENNIKFFLFSPHLTLFSSNKDNICYYPVGVAITYENGARVSTSFVSNLEKDIIIKTVPDLYNKIIKIQSGKRNNLNKYIYPRELITPYKLHQITKNGTELNIKSNEVHFVRKLDAGKGLTSKSGKSEMSIFGGGFLTNNVDYINNNNNKSCYSEEAFILNLSDREKNIIESLGYVK